MQYLREAIYLLIGSFACYRITQLIVMDDGPFDIIQKLRIRLGVYDYGENGSSTKALGRLFGCPYCIGVWVALILTLTLFPIGWLTIAYWFGIAGAQSLLENIAPRHGM